VNLALYKRGIESRFVTLMYGSLEPDGRLTYCNAGHNPPLVIGKEGVRRLEVGGPIVGLFPQAVFQEETVLLAPGDWLIVFSDGVSEAMAANGDEYGEERILAVVDQDPNLTPADLLKAIFADVRAFTKGAPQSDDITALVLRYGPSA
jgi:sigma-B regulation protein RsbU (phosphoserine phosphatase)